MSDQGEVPSFEDVTDERFRFLLSNATKWMAIAKEDFERANTETERCDAASRLVRWTLSAAAQAIGPEAMRLVYGTPVVSDRKVALLRAWHRLLIVEDLFECLDREDDLASFKSLRNELLAIANDDAPRLFDRVEGGGKGTRRDSYRLAHLRLRALGWETYLRANGLAASKAQRHVSDAYGRTWEAIRGWRQICSDLLFAENVERFLKAAADGSDPHYSVKADEHGLAEAIIGDGRALLDEERINAG